MFTKKKGMFFSHWLYVSSIHCLSTRFKLFSCVLISITVYLKKKKKKAKENITQSTKFYQKQIVWPFKNIKQN